MKKIFITGSTDGLGFMAAEQLLKLGHQVLLHARNAQRADMVMQKLPGATGTVIGDLSSIAETRALAQQVNKYGTFDAIIHNAAVGFQEPFLKTADGLPHVFAINSLAPFLLTCLVHPPKRLVYTSSGLHRQGNPDLDDMLWQKKRWNSLQAYSDTKLQNVLLGFAVSRYWSGIPTNVVTPGWVPTKMGGPHAPDNLEEAPETQVWLPSSDDNAAFVTGRFLYHKRNMAYLEVANDTGLQDAFVSKCEALTGIKLPIV